MRDKILYAICFGFLFGVFLRSLVFINLYLLLFFILIGSIVLLYFIFLSQDNNGIFLAIFLCAFSLGGILLNIHDKILPFGDITDKEVTLEGIIVEEPEKKVDTIKIDLKVKNEEGKTSEVLITTGLGKEYKYGEKLRVSGKIKPPENFETDTGKTFDYINYLRKDGIYYVMYYPKVEVLDGRGGSTIKRILFATKNKFLESTGALVSDPESTLLGGLILGERSTFSEDMRDKFVSTGTIHIVALSGYNVTIIAEWIMKGLRFLPERVGISAGIFAIILFVVMSGGGSTAVRAGIMAVLVLVARATGRTYDVLRVLILTAVLMVLFNPLILVFDVSFQLSFIATIAVIFWAPRLQQYLTWIPKKLGLREIAAATFSAYIFVLPFILYKMGNLSIVALPANFLILPFLPATMLLGFITGIVGMTLFPLAVPFGFVTQILLGYELRVIDFFSSFSFASFAVPNFPLVLVLIFYMYFIYYLFGRNIKKFFTDPD